MPKYMSYRSDSSPEVLTNAASVIQRGANVRVAGNYRQEIELHYQPMNLGVDASGPA
jgi:hypothetical protein